MKIPHPSILIALLFQTWISSALAYSTVNFTVSLDPSSALTNFTDFHEGEKGTGTVGAVPFYTEVTAIDGTPVNPGPIASFCTELQESISLTNYQFESHPLELVSAGRAGQSGTASIGIPIGGIGELRAARVRYLFDQYYVSNDISLWSQTDTQPLAGAFQIALWEITHDSDLSLSLTSGITYLAPQTDTRSINAIDIATGWLNSLASANITTAYTSTTWDVWTLVSTTGNTDGYGFQDVLFATTKSDPRNETFTTMNTVPEPSGPLLISLAAFALTLHRQRRPQPIRA